VSECTDVLGYLSMNITTRSSSHVIDDADDELVQLPL